MIIALFIGDVMGNIMPARIAEQDDVRLDGARRIYDQSRAKPAMMANAAAEYKHLAIK
jgi:hypothetical protein